MADDSPDKTTNAPSHDASSNREYEFEDAEFQSDDTPCQLNLEDQCQCGSALCREISLPLALDRALGFTNTHAQVEFSPSHMGKLWPILTRGQMDRETYLALLAEYCPQRHCGLVWPPGSVAYRCRTCSKTPSMALCADCFRCGNHEGHDYVMIKSRSGGTCDCGMDIVLSSGHCTKHGPNAVAKRENEIMPEELVCVPRRSMPRLIHRLCVPLRGSNPMDLNDEPNETHIIMESMSQLASDSAIFRCLIIDALLSENVYSSQIQFMTNHPDESVSQRINDGLEALERNRKGYVAIKVPANWNPPMIDAFVSDIKIECFLEELIFLAVYLEFPQKLSAFLLGFLMDDRYRMKFSRTFVTYYPHIMRLLVSGADDEPRRFLKDWYKLMSRRTQQITSQLYNEAELVDTLCSKDLTLHTLIYCLRIAIEGSPSNSIRGFLKDNPSCSLTKSGNVPKIISHNSAIIKDSHLMPLTQDLNIILDFSRQAQRLLNCTDLLNTWLEMLTYFQAMNPYKHRGDRDQLVFDDRALQNPLFTLETEFCLSPLWSILNHFKEATPSSVRYTVTLFKSIHAHLLNWFNRMGIGPDSLLDPYRMSFYIPIHRMFAATLRHLMFVQSKCDLDICDILVANQAITCDNFGFKPDHAQSANLTLADFCKMLLKHPLQVIAICNEARCTMGVRMLGRDQAVVTYAYMAYCYSTIDLDMFLLKYCASKLDPNYFLSTLLSKFNAWEWFSFNKTNHSMADTRKPFQDFRILPEQIVQMVENSLMVIIQLLTLSIYCNVSEREQTKQEMVALISVRDRSYSYLVDMMPEKSLPNEIESVDRNCKSLLEELTIFKPAQHGTGRNLQQGCYTLKQSVWQEAYDLVQVHYRFSQKRDYQMSLERFYQVCKQIGLLAKHCHSTSLWPPFKIPKNIGVFGQLDLSSLVECSTLIGVVFSVLFKHLYLSDMPDGIIASAIHLLELALRKGLENKSSKPTEGNGRSLSFIGLLSYRKLKGKTNLVNHDLVRGYPIYSSHGESPTKEESYDLFPVIKHALDLEFERTWFPFDSVIDNMLVHIENVHSSVSIDEFAAMLKNLQEDDKHCATKISVPAPSKSRVINTSTASFIGPDLLDPDFDDEMAWLATDMDFFVDETVTSDDTFDDSDEEEEEEVDDDDDDDDGNGDDDAMLVDGSLSQQQQQQESDVAKNNKERIGESLLTLLLRLHAKYSQKVRSYEFEEQRVKANASAQRSRIGDGAHFVSIVLDLVCILDLRMRPRIEQLQNLIWGDKEDAASQGQLMGTERDNISVGKTNPLGDKSAPVASSSSKSGSTSLEPKPATLSPLSAIERRRRAKEYQSKVMAQFASKQRAFIENYELGSMAHQQSRAYSHTSVAKRPAASTGDHEEPINLSSKSSAPPPPQPLPPPPPPISDLDKWRPQKQDSIGESNKRPAQPGDRAASNAAVLPMTSASASNEMPLYECCICGLEGPSELANPFGQVVHLQSTSILGHAHLRPQCERRLPCDEAHHLALREETYAKYLERRIELFSEHFSESSWLDSINIGVEGGVHVQSCGHYLHIECHQSYMKSVNQDRRRYFGGGGGGGVGGAAPGPYGGFPGGAASDEFPCPVCRQLANSVLPILSDLRRPAHRRSLPCQHQPTNAKDDLDQQIKLIGSLFNQRLPPHNKELQSSASFCAHLTKATGPQYRLVRSNASMHSLFLFLTSIARTNLESELIVRQALSAGDQQHINFAASTSSGTAGASGSTVVVVVPPTKKPLASSSSSTAAAASSSKQTATNKRSCFIHLFHVLALNAQTLINDQWFGCTEIWSHLTNCVDERNRLSVKPTNSEVPLLLRDPVAMLLQFLFATITATGSSSSRANFACLVKILLNLTAIQSIALLLSYLDKEVTEELLAWPEREDDEQAASFRRLLALVSHNLGPLLARANEEPLMNSVVRSSWLRFAPCTKAASSSSMSPMNVDAERAPIWLAENRVKLACLPFMRAAALLQHHLYPANDDDDHYATAGYPELRITSDELLTNAEAIEADYSSLATYLGLSWQVPVAGEKKRPPPNTTSGTSLAQTLNWPPAAAHSSGAQLIGSWSRELLLGRFGCEFSIAARTLLVCRSLAWFSPSLMRLPQLFDDVFMFYYRKKCSLCHQVRRDVAVCLVCGAPICFRMSCCKDRARSRLVHSQHCGSSTAVFLAVHTSSIVVIRGQRACVWGSVYLDAHGEEDNGLQRGKPLYLVPARFELLQRQWLTHSFDDKQGKFWINLHDEQQHHHHHHHHHQHHQHQHHHHHHQHHQHQ